MKLFVVVEVLIVVVVEVELFDVYICSFIGIDVYKDIVWYCCLDILDFGIVVNIECCGWIGV